jgi:hypothetical protein
LNKFPVLRCDSSCLLCQRLYRLAKPVPQLVFFNWLFVKNLFHGLFFCHKNSPFTAMI